jgi:nitroimidazol reductase NimA-like FMN-containing flavoprotein (pyridoxamine 5'-phosphate oxidase superfamily)
MQIIPIRRHGERAVPAESAEILRQGLVAHVGTILNGQPVVVPFTYQYDDAAPETIFLHGAQASSTLRRLAEGGPVCVTVTLADGLVYSRTANNHSMNYRSVVCLGTAAPIATEAERAAILARMIARYFPGRTVGADYAPAELGQLRATALLAVHIQAWSAKARRGDPTGPLDNESDAPGTWGVIDL